jgi:hypothetical protein
MSALSCNTKKPWTVDEDRHLTHLVLCHGTNNWSTLAELLTDRSGKQCRERWHNHLNPDIRKGEWAESEDQLILAMQRQLGNQWAKIAKHLNNGRSDNAVKNRFHAIIRARASQIPVASAESAMAENVFMAPAAATSTLASSSSFVPVAKHMSTIAPQQQPFQPQAHAQRVLVPIKQEKVEFSKEKQLTSNGSSSSKLAQQQSMFASLNNFSFIEAAKPLQMFATSAWNSTTTTATTSSSSLLSKPVVSDPFEHNKCSESPTPSLMSLSPVTVDEEFLDYWGISSSKDCHDEIDNMFVCSGVDDECMKMSQDELVGSFGSAGFEFGF